MTHVSGPTPTAEGSLEKSPFVHLLVYLAERRLSGTLVFGPSEPEPRDAVYFSGGAPCKVKTRDAVAHLGRVLFELGFLDEEALHASLLAIAGHAELQGEYLLRTGAIERSALLAGLREQTSRKLGHLFGLPIETSYAFYQDENLIASWGGPELTPLDPLSTVWKAICARSHEPIIEATLARLGNTVLKLHAQSDVARFGFSPHELSIIDLLRARPSRLSALVESQLLPERTARLVMYALVVTRHIDHRADGALPVGVSVDPERREGARGGDRPTGESGPISTSVPLARVKLARRVEPAKEERGPELAGLSPALLARRDEIVARAGTVDRDDYFAILGVSREASEGDLQAAYYGLAKTWHPDRLPSELESCRDSASKVFARINEAFETLADAARRKRYVEMLKVGSGTPEEADQVQQIIDAASEFQRAEILWRKRDIAGAEPYIRRAYAFDPKQSDYAALYAMLELAKRPPDAPVDDLMEVCDQAIAQSDRCERAFFCRGTLRKRAGKLEAAMSDFRAAYALNANNLDAGREVRVYEMRRSKQPDRRSTPASRRSSPPPAGKGAGLRTGSGKKGSLPPKDGGVLSGIGKLFKR